MIIDTDVLVLGSGIAGLSFALRAASFGRVALVTKKSDTESNTNYAQGGIAAVIDPLDTFEAHIQDTLIAGAHLCHEDAVGILVREGPERVRELIDLGVRFTRGDSSDNPLNLDLGREGGHSTRRIVHAADLTGREIERALIGRIKGSQDVKVFEHDYAIDLTTDRDGDRVTCTGAHVLDSETGDVMTVRSRVTMLATGGLCRIYLHTTNPDIATGDGVAMAYRAGAAIANMEFIQFHPTTLYHPDASSFLISEAVRGEGGILRLADGSTFMENYHPMGCLAPRDIVARAIDAELKKRGDKCAYLDVTHLDADKVRAHFPNIYEKCLSVGIDITREWIPVGPAAHYSCGGVLTDTNGRTSIDNLYANGEVACTGVHGANRLASNSLLEALVFARRAADDAQQRTSGIELGTPREYPMDSHIRPVDASHVDRLTTRLREVMWEQVGIVRSDERLLLAQREVREILLAAEETYREGRLSVPVLELRNMAQVAELIVLSARARKESRGLHYNVDWPEPNELFRRDTVLANGSRVPQLAAVDE